MVSLGISRVPTDALIVRCWFIFMRSEFNCAVLQHQHKKERLIHNALIDGHTATALSIESMQREIVTPPPIRLKESVEPLSLAGKYVPKGSSPSRWRFK